MGRKMDKPDYVDQDWTSLTEVKTAKWADMMEEIKEEGWVITELRTDMGFTSRLALKPVHEGKRRGIFIVCAGGAFLFKSSNEAKPVAEYFYRAGINVAILDYHVDPAKQKDSDKLDVRISAGEDGLAAIRYLRLHADELGICPDKIAIGGFSAGGMLSAYAATQISYGNPQAVDAAERVSSRPDAALILYGAMSDSGIQDSGMFAFDFKEQAERCKYDPVRNIHSDCPPMFVFQTHKDDPRHALLFCYELAGRGVPYELHTFGEGPHGGALYNGEDETPLFKHTSRWAPLAAEWLEEQGF